MAKELVICEKPSVARSVAIALGARATGTVWENDEWVVAAASGHLLETLVPDELDERWAVWSADTLPILPEELAWEPRGECSERLLAELHRQISRDDVAGIVNACDAAREGELIFKLILRTAPVGADKPVRRAWFASLTIGAIRRAFEQLRPDAEMRGLEAAAFGRQRADWLIGMNATRAATVRAGRTVRMGRVQTPTLAILAEREREIDAYVAVERSRVAVCVDGGAGHVVLDGPEYDVETEASAAVGALAGATLRVEQADDATAEVGPPMLFDLTELQADANRRHGYSAARTLSLAQTLYERGVLTYPRTDARFLTSDLVGTLGARLDAVAGAIPALGEAVAAGRARLEAGGPLRFVSNARVRDHHAIVPTEKTPEELDRHHANVYQLVACRLLAALGDDAVVRTVEVSVSLDGGQRFTARGEQVLVAGWQAIEPPQRRRPGVDVDALAAVAVTGTVTVLEATSRPSWPKRPRSHTDASLLGEMRRAGRPDHMEPSDWRGIGTPATRSETIEKLVKTGLADRRGAQLVATDRGCALIAALAGDPLTSGDLTAAWEQRLAGLEDGEAVEAFRADLDAFVRAETTRLLAADLRGPERAEPLGDCPRCGGAVTVRAASFSCDGAVAGDCDFVVWRWRSDRHRVDRRIGRAEARDRIARNDPHKSRTPRPVLAPERDAGPDGRTERVDLPAYTAWVPRTVIEDGLAEAIIDIVTAEQPVVVRRITRLVASHSTLTSAQARKVVNRTTARLVADGALAEEAEPGDGGQQSKVLRLAGADTPLSRRRGPRDIDEIPRSELAATAKLLGCHPDALGGPLDLPADDERVTRRLHETAMLPSAPRPIPAQ